MIPDMPVTLDLTPREAAILHELRAAQEQAQHAFRIAFAMACAAKGITDATLVALAGAQLVVSVPDAGGA